MFLLEKLEKVKVRKMDKPFFQRYNSVKIA